MGTDVILDGVCTTLFHCEQGHRDPREIVARHAKRYVLSLPREYIARSGQSGKPYPNKKIESLRDVALVRGYVSPYWITESQFTYFMPSLELKDGEDIAGTMLSVKEEEKNNGGDNNVGNHGVDFLQYRWC